MSIQKKPLAISAIVLTSLLSATHAADRDARFPERIASRIGGTDLNMRLTGSATRTKYGFRVYAIASYVQEGARVVGPEALARAGVHKQLHLIFERDVDGETMAQSFRDAIGMNHPAPAFSAELAQLEGFFRANPTRKGDHIWLTHVPGVGLGCHLVGKQPMTIANVDFAHAAWETYLGRVNLNASMKSALSSRL
jgi:hypothetical protein